MKRRQTQDIPRTLAALTRLGVLVLSLKFQPSSPAAPPTLDFNREIRPILSDKCFACHGPDDKQRKAQLRFDVRDSALKPAKSGATAIIPGKPEASELVKRITTTDADDRMPPAKFGKTLTPAQAEMLRRWVAEGAEFHEHWSFIPPKRPPIPPDTSAPEPKPLPNGNEIDAFVRARLAQEILQPSPEADRPTLARRVTLDLTGLPPTPGELDAFLADSSPQAYEKLVDRLLTSPRYGERMAVEWLDAARYADTHGYHLDSGRDMTAWRDGVIRAFNEGQPFDQFTLEQLAGDLLPNATRDQKIASGFNRNHMINYEGGAIPEEYQYAYLVDRVNTTSATWLGLSMACAQCHDHKYDPLTRSDFYRLLAFFNNVPENGLDGSRGNAAPTLRLPTPEQETHLAEIQKSITPAETRLSGPLPEIDAAQAQWESATTAQKTADGSVVTPSSTISEAASGESPKPREIPTAPPEILALLSKDPAARTPDDLAKIRRHYRDQVSPDYRKLKDELSALKKQRDDLEAQIPSAMVMAELKQPRDTFIRVRGQYDKLGDKVTAGTPAALPQLPPGEPPNRLGLARWLVSSDHPLTARVIVNRYWQMYFGTGIVRTAEDFGSQGEWPSHPDLLDWLAREFIESHWNVKHIQRLIVTSATYRQSTKVTPQLLQKDPENRLLSRGPRFRLQAEFIRDQALAVSGLLNPQIGGKSVSPYQPAGLWEELSMREDSRNFSAQFFVQSKGPDLYRRSMYTFWKRSSPPPQMSTFDAPDRETCTVRRPRTNTPLQALVLLNDPTYVEASRKLAERLLGHTGSDADRVAWAFRLATARTPTHPELAVLLRVLEQQRTHYRGHRDDAEHLLSNGDATRDLTLDAAELAAWTMVSSTILNLDETVTKG